MGVLNPNSTSYVHPDEPNLLNLHKAMEYDDAGKPHVRVTLGSDNITITGDVNLLDTVTVTSTPESPVHTHITEVGTSGILNVPYMPIGGAVTVTNTSFAITNFPTTSTVYQGTIPWITNTTVTNWPALQYVNGTLYAVQSGTWSVGVSGSVSVSNFTSTVNVASMPAVSGTVAVSSLPAVTGTVTVNGSITVTNFTSTVNVASLPAITGTVVVSNFTSTVRVDNFPTSVTVTNFTSTVFVSNTLTISNTSFAVTNFPTTSTVYQGTNPWNVTGTVVASNFTSTVNINSMPSVTISNTITFSNTSISITNFPTTSTVYQGTTPWTITGTVAISSLPEVEIKNDSGNPIPISKNTTPNSSSNPINVAITSALDTGINSSIDSKGRLKVQTQESIFFNTFQYGKETDVWDESTVSGGSASFNAVQSLVDMSVTSTTGSKIIRQTRQVMRYTSGRQNTLTFSVRLTNPTVGVRRRFGLFNGTDGFYFEDSGTLDANGLPEYAVVLTSTASGSQVTERVTRNNWNGDKLDGDGPSGITASPTAQQMISIEYEWYGAGQVVFTFIINGLPRVIHIFNTGNRLLLPWCRTPFLPIRLELENFGGTEGTHHLYQGSNSVLVEGRLVKQGIPENVLTPLTGITLDTALTFYPVVSVRMKPTALEAIIILSNFVANTLDNTDIYYKVLRNATLNGTWVDMPDANAFTQYNYTSTGAVTDGNQIDSGFITAGAAIRIELSKDADLQLGRGSMGTVSDTVTIAIAAKNANKKAVASLTWIEQR